MSYKKLGRTGLVDVVRRFKIKLVHMKEQWPRGRVTDFLPKGTGFESWVFFLLSFIFKLLIRSFKIKLDHMISKMEQWPSGRAPVSITKGSGFESWVFFY